MPELPEVETVTRSIAPLVGRHIVSAEFRSTRVLRGGDPDRMAAHLVAEVAHHIEGDIGLQERAANLAQRCIDVGFAERAAPGQAIQDAAELFRELVEHGQSRKRFQQTNLAPEGASRCRAFASGPFGPVGGSMMTALL